MGKPPGGSIPPELGQLNNLQKLDLDGNRLSGSIPPELGQLTNLNISETIGTIEFPCIILKSEESGEVKQMYPRQAEVISEHRVT